MATTAKCQFKKDERVVARRTFESNSVPMSRKTVLIGTAGVVEEVDDDEDMCVAFDGIDTPQWLFRNRQERNLDRLDESHDVG
eukprot:gene8237-3572_t